MKMQGTKITILCIPYTHTLSHISRPLAVAKELRERGHEVVFAGESPKTTFIRQEGFNVLPLHEPDPDMLFGNIRSGKLRFIRPAIMILPFNQTMIKEMPPCLFSVTPLINSFAIVHGCHAQRNLERHNLLGDSLCTFPIHKRPRFLGK